MADQIVVTGVRPRCGILITGGQGSGKSRLAMQLANFIGGNISVMDQRQFDSKFGFPAETNVVIAEEFKDIRALNHLLCSDTVICHRKHKDDVEISVPAVIATSQNAAPENQRRWIVISLGGEI